MPRKTTKSRTKHAKGGKVAQFFKDNGLSIAFIVLFVLCIVGQAVTGFYMQGHSPSSDAHAPTILMFVASSTFLRGVFSNWQAAVLQLFALIVLAVFLRQRGASHSRKPESENKKPNGRLTWFGRSGSWAYANSLSLAFLGIFFASFTGFFLTDAATDASERAAAGLQPLSRMDFFWSSKFWFDTLQTWEAEFFAMGAFLLLSIFLRQEGSAESKPVGASNNETGETNK